MKKLLFISGIAFISSNLLLAQTAGPQSGRVFSRSSLAGADKSWVNVGNASASDQLYANFGDLDANTGSHTDYLVASDFRFGIPAGSQVTGIEVYVENSDPGGSTADYSIRILKGAVIGSSEHSAGAMYLDPGERDVYRIYGDNSDLWGETWSYTDINTAGFGVAIAAQRAVTGKTTVGRVDNIRIAVYYAAPFTLPLKLVDFAAKLQNDKVRLTWTTTDESDMDRFELQRSPDATGFTSMGTVFCTNQKSRVNYTLTDYSPLTGSSFYRLKMMSKDGKSSYSKVLSINFDAANATLYPSPWKKGSALNIRNAGNKKLLVQFFSNSGEKIAGLSTSTGQLPVEQLANARGILRYKIYDDNNELAGSGTLIIY